MSSTAVRSFPRRPAANFSGAEKRINAFDHAGFAALFTAMCGGGYFGADKILDFNGGLFGDSDVIELTPAEIETLNLVNNFEWSDVEPSIFGTLFERTLDPLKRAQIGARYTSRENIETLLEPVMVWPLQRGLFPSRHRLNVLRSRCG